MDNSILGPWGRASDLHCQISADISLEVMASKPHHDSWSLAGA